MSHSLSRREGHQLNIEDERRIRRDDSAGTAAAVPQARRNAEHTLLSHLHVQECLIPALDDAADADLELERLATIIARIKLCTVEKVPSIMGLDLLARERLDTVAFLNNFVLQTRRGRAEAFKVGVREFLKPLCPLAIARGWSSQSRSEVPATVAKVAKPVQAARRVRSEAPLLCALGSRSARAGERTAARARVRRRSMCVLSEL